LDFELKYLVQWEDARSNLRKCPKIIDSRRKEEYIIIEGIN
jgi:hypothetical protein